MEILVIPFHLFIFPLKNILDFKICYFPLHLRFMEKEVTPLSRPLDYNLYVDILRYLCYIENFLSPLS